MKRGSGHHLWELLINSPYRLSKEEKSSFNMSSYSYFHQTGSNVLLGDGKKRREHCCINQVFLFFVPLGLFFSQLNWHIHLCLEAPSVWDQQSTNCPPLHTHKTIISLSPGTEVAAHKRPLIRSGFKICSMTSWRSRPLSHTFSLHFPVCEM